MDSNAILCIEDDPAVAKGLVFGLEQEGFTVFQTETAEEGYAVLKREDPQCLVLDIRLPGENGFDFCRRIRKEGFTLPVLMLTARDEEVDKILGLEIGADDYMVKPFSLRELVSRVRALMRRSYGELSRKEGDQLERFGPLRIEYTKMKVFYRDKEVFLTPLEFKLLTYLIEHSDRPLTRDQILNSVWGSGEYFGDDRTVDVHMRHLREKVEEDPSKPRFLHTVRGIGYKFTP